MRFNILIPPNTNIPITVNENTRIGDIINDLRRQYRVPDAVLIFLPGVDAFARIFDTDPMNLWYGGNIGDIYRITDRSTIKYRQVTKAIPESKSKKEKNNPNKFSPASAMTYFKAYNSVIDMMRGRQALKPDQASEADSFRKPLADIETIFNGNDLQMLTINGPINRKGKVMFAYFANIGDEEFVGNKKADYQEVIMKYVNMSVESYNSQAAGDGLAPPQLFDELPKSATGNKIEIIIIYNNSGNGTPISTKFPNIPWITVLSAQSIPMDLSRHCEQPEFMLLSPDEDRQEIREIYTLHGITLDEEKTVLDLGLKTGSRMVFI